jgi:hypothetical protein
MKAIDLVLDLYSQLNPGIWIVCAAILFLATMVILRLTRVHWVWSVLGGVMGIFVYSGLILLSYFLLETFIKAWIFG